MIGMLAAVNRAPALAFGWTSKAIQVEYHTHGHWAARDPLPLDRQFGVLGHAFGEADYQVMLESVVSKTGEIASVPRFVGRCSDGMGLTAKFDEKTVKRPWRANFECFGTWRLTLVDTAQALRELRAAPGALVPAGGP